MTFEADRFDADSDDGEGVAFVYFGSKDTMLMLSRFVDDRDEQAIELQLGHQEWQGWVADLTCIADTESLAVELTKHDARHFGKTQVVRANFSLEHSELGLLANSLSAVFGDGVGTLQLCEGLACLVERK